jgi:hypothetical protein
LLHTGKVETGIGIKAGPHVFLQHFTFSVTNLFRIFHKFANPAFEILYVRSQITDPGHIQRHHIYRSGQRVGTEETPAPMA